MPGFVKEVLNNKEHPSYEAVHKMMFLLSVCHSIYVDNEKNYHASSRDELAFVYFAKWCGYEFIGNDGSDHDKLIVEVNGR